MKTIIKLLSLTTVALVSLTLQTAKADWQGNHPTNCKAMEPDHEQYLFYDVNGVQNTANFHIWVVCPTMTRDAGTAIPLDMEVTFQNISATSHTCGHTMTRFRGTWGVTAFHGGSTPFTSGLQVLFIPNIVTNSTGFDMNSLYCALGPQAVLLHYFYFDDSVDI